VHRLYAKNGLQCFLSQVVHLKFYLRLCLKCQLIKIHFICEFYISVVLLMSLCVV
jgi:hypothetical protein